MMRKIRRKLRFFRRRGGVFLVPCFGWGEISDRKRSRAVFREHFWSTSRSISNFSRVFRFKSCVFGHAHGLKLREQWYLITRFLVFTFWINCAFFYLIFSPKTKLFSVHQNQHDNRRSLLSRSLLRRPRRLPREERMAEDRTWWFAPRRRSWPSIWRRDRKCKLVSTS